MRYHYMYREFTSIVYFAVNETTFLYRPLSWARTIKRFGTGILTLHRKISIINLTPLRLGIADLHVNLTQTPENCLYKLKPIDLEAKIRDLLLYDFQNSSTNGTREGLEENEKIYNMRSRKHGDTSDFYYECCHLTSKDGIECQELEAEWLMNVLLNCIRAAKLLVLLFAPYFIPKSYFKEKFKEVSFEHILPENKSASLTIKKIKRTNTTEVPNTIPLKLLCQKMPKFYETCHSSKVEENTLYKITVRKLEFNVNLKRLLSSSSAPVRISSSLFDSCILCKLRKIEPFVDCCEYSCHKRCCTFYQCCRLLTSILLVAIISIPWILRVLIYKFFEDEKYRSRDEHYRSNEMNTQLTWNLVTELTPYHPVFYICYSIIGLGLIVMLLIRLMRPKCFVPIQKIVRKSFRDTQNNSASNLLEWFLRLILEPFKNTSKCFSRIWALPLIFVALLLYIPPTINLVIRLVGYSIKSCSSSCSSCGSSCHMSSADTKCNIDIELTRIDNDNDNTNLKSHESCRVNDEISERNDDVNENTNLKSPESGRCNEEVKDMPNTNTNRYGLCSWDECGLNFLFDIDFKDMPEPILTCNTDKILRIVLLTACIMSILAVMFLAAQCIIFSVECIIYAIIGVILYSKTTFKYVTFAVMIILYFRECFVSVPQKFESFNREIHNLAVTRLHDKIKSIARKPYEEQRDTAFRLPARTGNQVMSCNPTLRFENKTPKWSMNGIIVFLSREDKTFITKKFFFDTVKMPHSGGPGNICKNILSAACEFVVMLTFLSFVLLVVAIFSDEYNMSGINQTLATVVTGALPFLIKKALIKSHGDLTLDTDDHNFENSLETVIDDYEQTWPIADIDVYQITKVETEAETVLPNGDDAIKSTHVCADLTNRGGANLCAKCNETNKKTEGEDTDVKIELTNRDSDTIVVLDANKGTKAERTEKANTSDIVNNNETEEDILIYFALD